MRATRRERSEDVDGLTLTCRRRWGSYNHKHGLAYTGGFGSLRSHGGGVGSIGSGVGGSSVEDRGDRGWPDKGLNSNSNANEKRGFM